MITVTIKEGNLAIPAAEAESRKEKKAKIAQEVEQPRNICPFPSLQAMPLFFLCLGLTFSGVTRS